MFYYAIMSLCYMIGTIYFYFLILNVFPYFFQNMIHCIYIKGVLWPLSGNISIEKLLFVLIHRINAFFKELSKGTNFTRILDDSSYNLLRKKRTFHNRSATSGVGLIYLLFYDMSALWFWMQSDMQFMISFLTWNSNPVFYNYQTVVVCWTVRGHMLHVYVYLYVKSLFIVWSYLLDEITPVISL